MKTMTKTLLAVGLSATVFAATQFTATNATAQDKVQLRFSTPATATDLRTAGLEEVFAPAVSEFASYEPSYNATLFKQGTELVAQARGNLEMSITSAQELAKLIPEWSVFTAGYLLRDADHQRKVFDESEIGEEMYALVEDKLDVKLLCVMYFGKRHLNLRGDAEIMTPEDMAGVKLRMPGTDAWQFLGSALGASPTPMAFTEVYTGLQTGAIDGQDNPLPTNKDKKFHEVTDQIVLTGHLADMNFLAISLDAYNAFDADQQAIVDQAADDACMKISNDVEANEAELVSFFEEQGLKVYEPDVDAFRTAVQTAYEGSEFAADWPEGMVARVNAVE